MRETCAPRADRVAEYRHAVGDVLGDRRSLDVVTGEDGVFELDLVSLAKPISFFGGGDSLVLVLGTLVNLVHPPGEDGAEIVLVTAEPWHADLGPAADGFLGDAEQVCQVAVADEPDRAR